MQTNAQPITPKEGKIYRLGNGFVKLKRQLRTMESGWWVGTFVHCTESGEPIYHYWSESESVQVQKTSILSSDRSGRLLKPYKHE